MVGNNTLVLNQATVIEALQEYINGRWSDDGRELVVKNVKQVNVQSVEVFEVRVETKEAEAPGG